MKDAAYNVKVSYKLMKVRQKSKTLKFNDSFFLVFRVYFVYNIDELESESEYLTNNTKAAIFFTSACLMNSFTTIILNNEGITNFSPEIFLGLTMLVGAFGMKDAVKNVKVLYKLMKAKQKSKTLK